MPRRSQRRGRKPKRLCRAICAASELCERERLSPQYQQNDLDPNAMSPKPLNRTERFCSPQDQIQWGILFLSRHLRGSSPWEREECLQDVWDWARKQGNLLWLQIIRDYRECLKESGPTYRRHQDWFLSNWNDPEFWAEWENRFSRSGAERTAESVCVKLARQRERQRASDRCADPL